MIPDKLNLVGFYINRYKVIELLADGPFSWVYFGKEDDSPLVAAIKVAKPLELCNLSPDSDPFQTGAKAIMEGGVVNVLPDPVELLEHLSTKMNLAFDASFPGITPVYQDFGLSFCWMDFLQGPTLRQVIKEQNVRTWQLIDLSQSMETLMKNSAFEGHHGDLKPENIIVQADGVRLIDLAAFGEYNCGKAPALFNCAVTTPAYYPFLKPDDLFAFGVMFWEIVCKKHPLISGDGDEKDKAASQKDDNGQLRPAVGDSLKEWVQSYENVGQYFLHPLLKLQRPSVLKPGIHPDLEKIALKGLRLQLSEDGLIERGPGFESFAEWTQVLSDIKANKIRKLQHPQSLED